MITAVPAKDNDAVTIPLVPIDARDGLLLLHAPPEVRSLNEVVNPWHTLKFPRIFVGKGLTVTVAVIKQVVGKV